MIKIKNPFSFCLAFLSSPLVYFYKSLYMCKDEDVYKSTFGNTYFLNLVVGLTESRANRYHGRTEQKLRT